MIDPLAFRTSISYNKEVEKTESPNPLRLKANLNGLSSLSNYNQVLLKSSSDNDIQEIKNKVNFINNMAPQKLEVPYSFKKEDINGERIYNKDGSLALIREYDNEVIRDYYPEDNLIKRVIERDKNTGAAIVQIEPQIKNGNTSKFNVTIFDEKINNRYTLLQVEEDGMISSITEFSGKGKSFRTLFINFYSLAPLRYLEAEDDETNEFLLTDCKFSSNGKICEIKKISASKEMKITYERNQKTVIVKENGQQI